jgi:hypothetical protein
MLVAFTGPLLTTMRKGGRRPLATRYRVGSSKLCSQPTGITNYPQNKADCLGHHHTGGQIRVPRQQLLIHRPSDIGQDASLIH